MRERDTACLGLLNGIILGTAVNEQVLIICICLRQHTLESMPYDIARIESDGYYGKFRLQSHYPFTFLYIIAHTSSTITAPTTIDI